MTSIGITTVKNSHTQRKNKKKIFRSLYFLLSPKIAAAPSPARIPINGIGEAGVVVDGTAADGVA